MHSRQPPYGSSFSWWQSVGMEIAAERAACRTVIPSVALTAFPSICRTISLNGDSRFILVSEVAQHAAKRIAGRLAERAQAGHSRYVGQVLEPADVAIPALAFRHVRQDLQHLQKAFAAGDALAAGFIGEEFEEIPRHVHHVGLVAHDEQAAGADRGAQRGKRVEIER